MKAWAWIILRRMHRSTAWVIRSVKWWLLPGSYLTDCSKNFQIYESVSWKRASRGCKPVSSVSTVVGKLISNTIENEHLTDEDKHAVLHGNAERFYGLKPLG